MPARRAYLAAALVAAATAVDAVRCLEQVGFRYVDQDVATYWFAAQEFARLRFREPFFYGQGYNHLGEALIAAPWIGAGFPPWIVLVGVSVAVGLLPWAVLARLAWRRGALALAVLFLGAPLLFPIGYQLLLARFFGMGLALVAGALLAVDSMWGPSRWFVAGVLAGLGCLAVPNAVLLLAAALAWLATTSLRGVRAWTLLAGGAAVAAAIWGLGRLFYLRHPDWVVHPAPVLGVEPSLVFQGLRDLPRHLGRVTPWVLVHPAIVLAGLFVVVTRSAWRRRWPTMLSAAAVLAGVLAILAVPKAHDGSPSVFFAYERMFLGLPLALAVVALAGLDDGSWTALRSARSAWISAALVLAVALPREFVLDRETSHEVAIPQQALTVEDVEIVRWACAAAEESARAARTDLVLFATDQAQAYACGALAYGRLTTIYPQRERRTWLLLKERKRTRDAMLVVSDSNVMTCAAVARAGPDAECRALGGPAVLVRFSPASALDVAERMGLKVRMVGGSGP